jgi:ABC-type Fe3+ transport system permease subunit
MTQTPPPRLPDRTTVFIAPLCFLIVGVAFAAVVVVDAFEIDGRTYRQTHHRTVRDQLLSEMMASLARTLGVAGSIALAVVLVGALGAWFVVSVRRYRKLVAADRASVGLSPAAR